MKQSEEDRCVRKSELLETGRTWERKEQGRFVITDKRSRIRRQVE